MASEEGGMVRQGPVAEEEDVEEESSAELLGCWFWSLSQAGGRVFVRGRRGRWVVVRVDGGGRGGLRGLVHGCWLDGKKFGERW